ncbi:hypothetical protein D3C78_1182490 [compost metagenome]
MVEVREVAVLAAHAPSTVDQEEYLLVAFVLVFAGDRRALARGGFPVDLAQGVAVAEFAQLVELQAEPAALSGAHADPVQPVIHGHQLGAVDAREVGIDAGFVAGFQIASAAPEVQRAAQLDFAAREDEVSARQRAHAIAELRAFARAQFDRLRQVLEIHLVGQVVEQSHALCLGEAVMQLQAHLTPTPQRQVAAELALQAW